MKLRCQMLSRLATGRLRTNLNDRLPSSGVTMLRTEEHRSPHPVVSLVRSDPFVERVVPDELWMHVVPHLERVTAATTGLAVRVVCFSVLALLRRIARAEWIETTRGLFGCRCGRQQQP